MLCVLLPEYVGFDQACTLLFYRQLIVVILGPLLGALQLLEKTTLRFSHLNTCSKRISRRIL